MGSLQVPGLATTPVARPKLPASKPTANRLPPPTLFQGQPSRNASNISLAPHTPATAAPGPPKPPILSHGPGQQSQQAPRFSKTPGPPVSSAIGTQQGDAKNENDRANALWAEMQNSLADVDLSASDTSQVYSPEH